MRTRMERSLQGEVTAIENVRIEHALWLAIQVTGVRYLSV